MKEKKTIGATIKELRKEKGYTQEMFGSKIGCSKGAVSKIETGKMSPTIEDLMKMAEVLGVDLGYFLCNTLQSEDYELAVVKSFIERFVRITTMNEYFNKSNDMIFDPDEFVFSLLNNAENSLILQMDESLLDFFGEIAEIENSEEKLKEQEYKNRILAALRKLHKSKPGKKINSYCLASVKDMENLIDKAVDKEIKGIRAIEGALEKKETEPLRLSSPALK